MFSSGLLNGARGRVGQQTRWSGDTQSGSGVVFILIELLSLLLSNNISSNYLKTQKLFTMSEKVLYLIFVLIILLKLRNAPILYLPSGNYKLSKMPSIQELHAQLHITPTFQWGFQSLCSRKPIKFCYLLLNFNIRISCIMFYYLPIIWAF